MRYIIFVLIISLGLSTGLKAQYFFRPAEYGIVLGGAQYFGDLNDEYGFKYIRPVTGIFVRYHLNPYISLRFSGSYAKVGYDDNLNNNAYNKIRNLSFRSDIAEGIVQAEFNFFRYATGDPKHRWTPYITLGVGGFYYNPYTTLESKKYFLRGMGTEGQNAGYDDRRYNTFAMCFPVGAGFKYWLAPGFNVGLEVANRLTTTDYMDDVSTTYVGTDKFPSDPLNPNPATILQDRSVEVNGATPLGREGKQRGNSSTKDQYMYMIINFSFQLKTYKCPDYLKRGELY